MGNNFPQIASPPLPPWNLRIWRVFVVSPHEKPSCSSTTIGLGRTCVPYQLWTVHRHQHQPYSRCWRSCRVKSHLRHDTPVRYDAVPCHWTDPVRKANSSSFWVKLDGISLPPSRRMFSLLSLSKIWKFHLSHQLHSKVWLLTFKALEGSKSKDVSRPQHPQRSCAKRPRSLGSEMLSSVWTSCLADPHGSGRWKTWEGTKTSQRSSKCPQSGLKPPTGIKWISIHCPVLCVYIHVFTISWQPWQFWPKYGINSGKMQWNIGLMTTLRVGCWCENPPQEVRVGNSLVLKHLLNTAHWPSTSLPSFNVFRKNIGQVMSECDRKPPHSWNSKSTMTTWSWSSMYQTKHLWFEARLTLVNEAPHCSCVLVV